MKVQERFLQYIKINTTSDPDSKSIPSTQNQFNLANVLKKELIELGLNDVVLDDSCYLTARLKSTSKNFINHPKIGLIAHLDTSSESIGENVKPQVIYNYQGQQIKLGDSGKVLSPTDFPELNKYIGDDLITTSGDTLLGADDKAGIAEIMTCLEQIKNSGAEHGDIYIAFTPDEEIGQSLDKFPFKRFNVDYAYTIDGGQLGELEYESFNAASAKIKIVGRVVHPGTAYNKLINALLINSEIISQLPFDERPENTKDYDGYFYVHKSSGTSGLVDTEILIRDFDLNNFNKRKLQLIKLVNEINLKYNYEPIEIEIIDQYYNMGEKIKPHFEIVEQVKNIMIEQNITPIIKPIRGGTDGSKLSYSGIPCPNIFAGGENMHGEYEYISIQTMEKSVQVLFQLLVIVKSQK
jgi:tripeptide aminopeptidase